MIIDDLKPLARPMDDFVLDPANARLHPDRNIESLKASLRKFGQRKPIVCQRDPSGQLVVRAGNGTVEAATALGWKELAVVVVEEDDASAVGYAIADNRTAELAIWDDMVLSQLMSSIIEDERELLVGFDDFETDALLKMSQELEIADSDAGSEGQGADDTMQARFIILGPYDRRDEIVEALEAFCTEHDLEFER